MASDRLAGLVIAISSFLAGCGPISAALHDPRSLPAAPQDNRVHHEPGAEPYAQAVAAILPAAMAKVEATHGRPFGKPFVVVAYLNDDSYAAANGRGDANPRGVTFFDRVTLSPHLWRKERELLEADLTHELSHEHLSSRLSTLEYYRIPIWFTEGIAVMASDGGGAQRVSEAEAQRAICAGRSIEASDSPNPFGNVSLKAPVIEGDDMRLRMHMAYRQAGLFVAWLRKSNPAAFRALLDRIYEGEQFKPAFEASYKSNVALIWREFVDRCPPA